MTSIPPLIPDSTNFEAMYTSILKTGTVISTTFTDGTAIITNGHVYNLLEPVNPSDAATKNYADVNVVSSIPGDPFYSVQYNLSNNFTGTSDLLYANSTGTTATSTSVTGATLIASRALIGSPGTYVSIYPDKTVTGINSITNPLDAVNKTYCDSRYTLSTSTDSTVTGITYTATAIVKCILYRTTSNAGTTITDTMPTATNIATALTSLDLTSAVFYLVNTNTDDDSIIQLDTNTGITIVNPTQSSGYICILYPGYQMSCILIKNSPSSVSMYVYSVSNTRTNNNFKINPRIPSIYSNNTVVNSRYSINPSVIQTISDVNYSYLPTDLYKIIYRNYAGPKNDSFVNVSLFITTYLNQNSPFSYFGSSGGVEFVIKNISSTGSLVISSGNGWTVDPNSTMTIPINKAGKFYVAVDTVNVVGYIYCISID